MTSGRPLLLTRRIITCSSVRLRRQELRVHRRPKGCPDVQRQERPRRSAHPGADRVQLNRQQRRSPPTGSLGMVAPQVTAVVGAVVRRSRVRRQAIDRPARVTKARRNVARSRLDRWRGRFHRAMAVPRRRLAQIELQVRRCSVSFRSIAKTRSVRSSEAPALERSAPHEADPGRHQPESSTPGIESPMKGSHGLDGVGAATRPPQPPEGRQRHELPARSR